MADHPTAPDDPGAFLAALEREMQSQGIDTTTPGIKRVRIGGFDPFVPEITEPSAIDAHALTGMEGGGLPGQWIDPERPRVEVARFPVIGAGLATGKGGTLRLTLAIEREFKYDAMPVTDWAGVQLECVFTRACMPGETPDTQKIGMGEALAIVRREMAVDVQHGPPPSDDDDGDD